MEGPRCLIAVEGKSVEKSRTDLDYMACIFPSRGEMWWTEISMTSMTRINFIDRGKQGQM